MSRTLNTLEFNTGRQYTDKGQRIIAIEVEVGVCPIFDSELTTVEFHDIDRHVAGRITIDGSITEAKVMHMYDNGRYVGIQSTYF